MRGGGGDELELRHGWLDGLLYIIRSKIPSKGGWYLRWYNK